MPDITLPPLGGKPWNLNPPINAINDALDAVISIDEGPFKTALDSVIDEAITDVISGDPEVIDAVADAILANDGIVLAEGSGNLIIRGENEAPTWLQAGNYVDAETGVTLPTAASVEALGRVGVPAAAGTGSLVIKGENGVDTWLQAATYVDPETGIAPPTYNALAVLERSGVVLAWEGAPPDDLDLAPGVTRIYLNDGEPVLAFGEDE